MAKKEMEEIFRRLASQDAKIADQNKKMADQNKKMADQNKKMADQNKKIEQLTSARVEDAVKIENLERTMATVREKVGKGMKNLAQRSLDMEKWLQEQDAKISKLDDLEEVFNNRIYELHDLLEPIRGSTPNVSTISAVDIGDELSSDVEEDEEQERNAGKPADP